MEGYNGTISPPGMYVRALYDYVADDPTSLSFRQGDIIQVLTQLDSGWWDGIIHGVRGWFPSNYCVPITVNSHRLDQTTESGSEADGEGEYEEDYDDHDFEASLPIYDDTEAQANRRPAGRRDEEEAAFWIPQATPDGRLFYFNTLTGDSMMELPLESPRSGNESGPREYTNAFASDQVRPPAEMMAAGYERDEDTDKDMSASEAEELSRSRSSLQTRRHSYRSDGASPATSMESLEIVASSFQSHSDHGNVQHGPYPLRKLQTSFIGAPSSIVKGAAAVPPHHFAASEAVPLTWNRLMEDMRRSVERYRQVVNAGESSEYVRRAEDISDHLRLVLAAGSGTTDNHSGNPSIISSNKALYPHFRDMMSKFSKLVLSSHIAAADWPAGDARSRCIQEADGVLNGVYGYVEVARQQRGEEIPRLLPGFLSGHQIGGSWQGNGVLSPDSTGPKPFMNHDDDDSVVEPDAQLSPVFLEKMRTLETSIVSGIRDLVEKLVVQDKILNHKKHARISKSICIACEGLVELCKPWMTAFESINLSSPNYRTQAKQLLELNVKKQKAYTLIADLVLACQAVAAPLADEWSAHRGESLEERLNRVCVTCKELGALTSQVNQCYRTLLDTLPQAAQSGDQVRNVEAKLPHKTSLSTSSKPGNRSLLGDITQAVSYAEANNTGGGHFMNVESSKVKKFFGEVPAAGSKRDSQDGPTFLRLDHEGEVQYDERTIPHTIRGGTLTGLVEQLTRHDRYDSPFNATFLLTYQSFTTASELFEMLVRRWNVQPHSGLSKDEYALWVERKQAPIRFRIVNVLKSWLDTYWMEGNDVRSKELIQKVYNFARDTIATSGTPGARPLMLVIEQRMRGDETNARRLVPNSNVDPPAPILPKNLKKLKFLEIDATEFARQLTIIESRLYGKIKPHECLNKIWQKKNASLDAEPAANVKSLILHSNRLTNWAAEMILIQQDVKKRVAVIKHFVNIADKCLSLHNFSTLTSIISAFATAPITRLSRTWNQVNAKTTTTLEKLRRLMGSTKNFAEYRETLHLANPPCIPFFGVYLTDLTFIEDGIPSLIKKTDLINFSKRAKTAEVIREIQTYQTASYPFKSIPELQDYVLSMMQSAGDVHEMYDRSLQIEPREREDEKIARLLSESGFL